MRVARSLAPVVVVALVTSGCTLWGWGRNQVGQLGDGTTTGSPSPTQTVDAADWRLAISAGHEHSCGIRLDATLWCWGSNVAGRLGDGTTTDRHDPVQVGTDTDWKSVAAGRTHTCATKADDSLWCWGSNSSGQFGDGTTTGSTTPVPIGSAKWISIGAGHSFTCGVRGVGSLWCWGWNGQGQLGDGTTITRTSPVRVGTESWRSVALGREHACAVRQDDSLWCWGGNRSGQLGDATTDDRSLPRQVCNESWGVCVFIGPVYSTWKSVSAGGAFDGPGDHTCAIRSDDTAWCWGSNTAGQLGVGASVAGRLSTASHAVSAGPWKSVQAGGGHTCAIRGDATLWCWGSNTHGQVGDGTTTARDTPVQIGTLAGWQLVSAGLHHTHAVRIDG